MATPRGYDEAIEVASRARGPPSMRPTRSDLGSLVQSRAVRCRVMARVVHVLAVPFCALKCPNRRGSTISHLAVIVIPALGPRPCSLRRVNPTVAAAKETSDMDHMNHMNHGGGLKGATMRLAGGMGHSMKGMPVAFEWGHRVTLFFDGWATETSFDYVVALFGLFLLCVAQEQLYHFRTSSA